MDVRHVVMVCKLFAIEGLARGGRSRYEDLHRLQAALLAKLVLHCLDVERKTSLAMPIKVNIACPFVTFTSSNE